MRSVIAFTQLDEPVKAQRQPDRFAYLDWAKILGRYDRLVDPLLVKELACYRVRWVVDQAEIRSVSLKEPTKMAAMS